MTTKAKKEPGKNSILLRNIAPVIACIVMLLILHSILQTTPDYSSVWTVESADGLSWVHGTEGSAISVPSKSTEFQVVKNANRMVDVDAGYALQTKRLVAYALRNAYVFAETEIKGDLSSEELIDELETIGHIRVLGAQKIASAEKKGRKLTKTLYSCNADVLFNAEYYGSYAGYLSIIQKGETYKVMFSGTVDGSSPDILLTSAKNHFYKEYQVPTPNAGNAPETDATKMMGSKVNPGTKGRIKTWLRTKEGAVLTDMGLTLTDIYYVSQKDLQDMLAHAGRTELRIPAPPEGMQYAVAEFECDTFGQDVSEELPFIRVRVTDGDGSAPETGTNTYIITQTKDTVKIFFPVKTGKDIRLYAGTEGLRIDCHPREKKEAK